MLNDIASNTSFFGIFITGVAYVLACAIQKRFKASILNPLLVSCVILIIFMLVSGIDYNVYLYGKPNADGTYDGTGAIFFQNMLTPTTVCLAIPLYEKLVYLKKYPVAIIGGILAGMFACLGGVLVLSMAFGLDHTQYVTLLPKSITPLPCRISTVRYWRLSLSCHPKTCAACRTFRKALKTAF